MVAILKSLVANSTSICVSKEFMRSWCFPADFMTCRRTSEGTIDASCAVDAMVSARPVQLKFRVSFGKPSGFGYSIDYLRCIFAGFVPLSAQ